MRDRLEDFGENAEVVLITFTDRQRAAQYAQRYGLRFPVLVDADRSVYRSYGLGRGTTARIWSPSVLRRYAQIVRRNGFGDLHRATEDTRQLGGDFVISPGGIVTYGFWAAGPDERPSVTDMLTAAAEAAANG